MNKIIYIAALSHSGSTLLDLLLGSNSDVVSLGEIGSAIKKFHRPHHPCTCGHSVDECPIWGRWRAVVRDHGHYTHADKYRLLLEIVSDVYGQDKLVVDSSKSISYLDLLLAGVGNDVKVLFLLKDIRSFVTSRVMRRKIPERMKKDGWGRFYTTSVPYNALRWYRENRQMKRYLSQCGVDVLQLGYEELCFHPEAMLARISEFLGITYSQDMLTPGNADSHIIRGNLMRYDRARTSAISYDYRWLLCSECLFYSWLYLPFMPWNRKNVYSHDMNHRQTASTLVSV